MWDPPHSCSISLYFHYNPDYFALHMHYFPAVNGNNLQNNKQKKRRQCLWCFVTFHSLREFESSALSTRESLWWHTTLHFSTPTSNKKTHLSHPQAYFNKLEFFHHLIPFVFFLLADIHTIWHPICSIICVCRYNLSLSYLFLSLLKEGFNLIKKVTLFTLLIYINIQKKKKKKLKQSIIIAFNLT